MVDSGARGVGGRVAGGWRAGEGTGPGRAGAREGMVRSKLSPGVRGAAVAATALAGCGRGRDGRGCGEWEKPHAGATDESPKCLLVTEMWGSPFFLPSSTTLRSRDGSLGGLWRPQLSERVRGPRSPPSEGREV